MVHLRHANISVCYFLLIAPLHAQYLGGNSDGNHDIYAANLGLGVDPCKGDGGDGDRSSLAPYPAIGTNPSRGGNGDGDKNASALGKAPWGYLMYKGGISQDFAFAQELNAPMPVMLLNFFGRWGDEDVLLERTTASESNNDHFELERSSKLSQMEKIGITKMWRKSVNLFTHGDLKKQKEYIQTLLSVK